jgi:hypothetical protein
MGVYERVVEVATPYFGLGAQRFVDRQLRAHLDIKPEELDYQHLDELAKWCLLGGKLFLQDEKAATEIADKIRQLKK